MRVGEALELFGNIPKIRHVLQTLDDDQSVQLLAPFSRYFGNATGSGNFVDVTVPPLLIPDNAIAACNGRTNSSSGCTP